MSLDASTYLRHLRADGAALADAAERNLTAAVPSCPGYDTGSLVIHTGGVLRYFAACMARDARVDVDVLAPPPADFVGWFREGLDELVSTLEQRGPADPTWTWGSAQSTAFWHRRAAQETSVHRWDVENAVGEAAPIHPLLAIDGIDEMFDEFFVYDDEVDVPTGSGETIHLHATDGPGEWLLTIGPDGVDIAREHSKGDVAARGPASDLLLMLYGRVPVANLEVHGDAALLERWQREVHI